MEFIDRIKQRIGRFFLSRDHAEKISRYSQSFKEIESIGILYEATGDDVNMVRQYATKLRNEGKKVYELGYYNQKELTFDVNFTLNSEYLHRQHMRWYGLPMADAVNGFKAEPFDLLLNLYTTDVLPLFYVSLHSKAKFRLGKYEQINLEFFDMMIDTGKDQALQSLINNIDHYIRKL
jgi:hypothetical protein